MLENIGTKVKEQNKMIVIYHKNCMDGLAAAFALHILYTRTQVPAIFIPMSYTCDINKIKEEHDFLPDDEIIFADFSLKRGLMIELIMNHKKVTILDHHETAEKELIGLDTKFTNVNLIFDMKRSGAMIARDYANTILKDDNAIGSKLFEYVQDRDLWNWLLLGSREVSEVLAVKIESNDIESFGKFYEDFDIARCIYQGEILLERKEKSVQKKIGDDSTRFLTINGTKFVSRNSTGDISETGNALCLKHNMPSMQYFILPDNKVVFSFRSTVDIGAVNNIAYALGGGGHESSCGATVSLEVLLELLTIGEYDCREG